MDLQTIRTELRPKIGNPSTANVSDTQLNGVVNEAYKFITDRYPFNETREIVSFSTVANTPRYTVPGDLSVLLKVWDDTNKVKLKKRGVRFLASLPANRPTGLPLNYVRVEDFIQIDPIPAAVYSIMLYYIQVPPTLTADTDTPVIPVGWHYGIVLKARHVYYDNLGDIGKAIYAKNEWKEWVSDKPSEIDQEKEDYDDTGVVLPELGREVGFGGYRDRRFDPLFDSEC